MKGPGGSFSKEKLLKGFDRKELTDWHPEMKHGKVAYEAILEVLKSGELNENQATNALYALFRWRGWGDSREVLDVLVDLSNDARLRVRSAAVKLAVGLVRFSSVIDGKRLDFSVEQQAALHSAIAAGLEPEVAGLAKKFFSPPSNEGPTRG